MTRHCVIEGGHGVLTTQKPSLECICIRRHVVVQKLHMILIFDNFTCSRRYITHSLCFLNYLLIHIEIYLELFRLNRKSLNWHTKYHGNNSHLYRGWASTNFDKIFRFRDCRLCQQYYMLIRKSPDMTQLLRMVHIFKALVTFAIQINRTIDASLNSITAKVCGKVYLINPWGSFCLALIPVWLQPPKFGNG